MMSFSYFMKMICEIALIKIIMISANIHVRSKH